MSSSHQIDDLPLLLDYPVIPRPGQIFLYLSMLGVPDTSAVRADFQAGPGA